MGLDGIISPGLALPAIHHGQVSNIGLNCIYTFLYNLLDYPTGVVPITTIR